MMDNLLLSTVAYRAVLWLGGGLPLVVPKLVAGDHIFLLFGCPFVR